MPVNKRQGYPLSSTFFNIYIGDIRKKWQNALKGDYYKNTVPVTILLFAGD